MIEIRDERAQQDFVTNKLLLVFTMVFIGIFVSMYMYRSANYSSVGYLKIASVLEWTFYSTSALTILSAGKWFLDRKKPVLNPYKMLIPKHIFFISFVIAICSGFASYVSLLVAAKYIYMLLSVVAVQYFILVSYAKHIYFMSATSIVNLILLYFVGSGSNNKSIFFTIISLIFLGASFLFSNILRKKDGKIKNYTIFSENTNYKLIAINTSALVLITIISCMFSFLGYSIGLILGGIYLVVVIFYNTLKLL